VNKLLTPEEVAIMLGVKLSTIYQWTHQGFIPYVKLGRLVRFKEGAVMKWLEKKANPGMVTRRIDVRELGV
jgi:excisionase family DNA binding protein